MDEAKDRDRLCRAVDTETDLHSPGWRAEVSTKTLGLEEALSSGSVDVAATQAHLVDRGVATGIVVDTNRGVDSCGLLIPVWIAIRTESSQSARELLAVDKNRIRNGGVSLVVIGV